MKILHIVSSYWPAFEFGGPITSVHFLNRWLVKNGLDITVYTTNAGLRGREDVVLKKETIIDGVKIYYFPYYGYVHWTFSPALFWALAKNIKKFDLIHITGVWNFPVSAAAFWTRFYRKPYIISSRGSLMKEPLEKKSSLKKKIYLVLFSKKDLKFASAIHFTVEQEKEEYLKASLPLKKAIVIPNGLDAEEFNTITRDSIEFRKKFGIAADKKIILFLSRLNWKKGLDTLIPAFSEVLKKEPKAVLVLAGPDDEGYKKNIQLLITNYQLQDNIIFTGMLVGEDKVAVFQESSVFVLPSYSENFGQVVVEAMYFGLPVIITKNVGISPSVIRAEAGLVIDKDENQLAEAILKILENPELRRKMGQKGKKLVETEFSSEKVAENWIEEYNNLINV